MKLEHFLIPYTKINSKWIEDLNVRTETIKLLEENIGKTLSDINHSRILYDPPPRILETKAKINKWDLMKLKSFCTANDLIFVEPIAVGIMLKTASEISVSSYTHHMHYYWVGQKFC